MTAAAILMYNPKNMQNKSKINPNFMQKMIDNSPHFVYSYRLTNAEYGIDKS